MGINSYLISSNWSLERRRRSVRLVEKAAQLIRWFALLLWEDSRSAMPLDSLFKRLYLCETESQLCEVSQTFYTCINLYKNNGKPNEYAAFRRILMTTLSCSDVFITQVLWFILR